MQSEYERLLAEGVEIDKYGRNTLNGQFVQGFPHKPGPGRPKGSRNKLSQQLLDRFARGTEEGLSPEDVMMQIYQDPTMSPDLRLKAAAKIGDWIYPRASSVEVTIDEKEALTPDQIDERIKQLVALGVKGDN